MAEAGEGPRDGIWRCRLTMTRSLSPPSPAAPSQSGGPQTPTSKPEWWRLTVPLDDLPQSFKLASAVFLLAPDRDSAWEALSRALWHGMAMDEVAADR